MAVDCPKIPQWMRMVYYVTIGIAAYAVYITYVAEKNQFSGQWLYVVVAVMAVFVVDNMMHSWALEDYLDLEGTCPKAERR